MAQLIMASLLDKHNCTTIKVISRGLSVFGEFPISPHAHTLMDELNIDASSHHSKLLTVDDLADDTLILTMTRHHKEIVCSLFPKYCSQAYTLAEYTIGEDFDIYDPYGGSIHVYRQCFMQLDKLIHELLKKTCLQLKKDVY